jgi:hypothetical protein
LVLRNPRAGKTHTHEVLVGHGLQGRRGIDEIFSVINVVHVDADGSPRSYHAEDPRGRGHCAIARRADGSAVMSGICALDEFASGGIKVFRNGSPLRGDELERQWRLLWPLIRQRQLVSSDLRTVARTKPMRDYYIFHSSVSGLSVVFKRHIIPPTQDGYPCTFGPAASHPGYFVSATSLTNANAEPLPEAVAPRECRAERYINPEEIPFFVLPGGAIGSARVGDVVIAARLNGGVPRVIYGVIGDAGPAQGFGEGSIAFVQELWGRKGEPVMNSAAVNALDIGRNANMSIALLILGGTRQDFGGVYTAEQLIRVGREAFAKWGGAQAIERLLSCAMHVMDGR